MKQQAIIKTPENTIGHPHKRNEQFFFQPKLTINQPNDIYEQEANAIADHVIPDNAVQQSFFKPSITNVQRKCTHCEEEEKKVQRKETGKTENYINTLSGGEVLSNKERSFFESKIGYDFSGVKLHTNTEANQSAKNINALAYTHGNNIVFGEGQYQPDTDAGKRLLAHELTHVVQQGAHNSTATVQRDVGWARSASGKPYGDPITGYTNERVDETISNAPDEHKEWNLTTWWYSKFSVSYDLNTNTVTANVKLYTTANAATKAAWEKAIEDKWSKKYKIQELNAEGKEISKKDIIIDVQWVAKPEDAHYTITPAKAGNTTDGRAGLGGTSSMTDWGEKDTVDITHEFGHMLGNTEEYFTTNNVDYTEGGKKQGWRAKGGGVMNNPAENPSPRHYEAIRKSVVKLLFAEDKNIKVI
ncbi:eCIS core domain-containing protein [Parafilimonas sp.]|uniref:eCIS core domain-containing protein n=1 Tax=Parafilimonas sp. TaxID=1969739 RepID=UPI003F7F83AE